MDGFAWGKGWEGVGGCRRDEEKRDGELFIKKNGDSSKGIESIE